MSEPERFANKLEEIGNDLQAYFDNHGDAWQDGDRGQAVQEAVDSIAEAVNSLRGC